MRIFLTITAFILFLEPAWAEPVGDFPFEMHEGLIWIQVRVPQSAKPLHFMLDSGAQVSVINLPAARQCGLRLGNRVIVRGVETSIEGYWPEHLSASIGEIQLPKNYLAVDLEALSQVCNCGVDGLLGADFFRNHVVQIDYATQRIRLIKSSAAVESSETLPLEMRPCGMRVPLKVNGGKEEWVRLDTGCASALHWVTSPVAFERCSRQPAVGVAKLSVPQAKADIQLGHFEFKAVPTGLHDKEIFAGEAGLLGNGLLSRFSRVTIDAQAGKLLLQGFSGEN